MTTGGRREGAGRPRSKDPKVARTFRIPLSRYKETVEKINQLIKEIET